MSSSLKDLRVSTKALLASDDVGATLCDMGFDPKVARAITDSKGFDAARSPAGLPEGNRKH